MLLDGVRDYAIFMIDPKGLVLSWNAGAERTKGYPAGEILGRNFACFFPPEDVQRGWPEELLRMTAASGRHEEQAIRMRRDGSQFLAHVTLAALHDREGKLRGFSEISRDLSASRETEARYRGLLEAAPDAMVVVNTGGEIVLLNVQAEKQFGYRRDELVGQPVNEHHSGRLRGAADRRRTRYGGRGAGAADRHRHRAHRRGARTAAPFRSRSCSARSRAPRGSWSRRRSATSACARPRRAHLAQMEGRYRGLLEAAPDAMVVVNQGGEIVLLNVQAEKQFGYHRDELARAAGDEHHSGGLRRAADRRRHFARRPTRWRSRSAPASSSSARRKDGSEFPIEIMLSPLESAEGILVTAAIRDISVRKAAEKHLAQMEGRYRGLLEAAPDAMVVVNQDGEIVLLNLQAEKQFGYRRDELARAAGDEHHSGGLRRAADRRRHSARRRTRWRSRSAPASSSSARRKDGSEFPIEIMLSPLESAEGILVTAAIRDISVRKAAETHLAQMEGRYRGLLEAAPDAMVVVNHDGEIVLLNVQAEKQFGYHRDELARAEGEEHHSGGLRRAADRRRAALGGGRAGAADRHRDRALGPAEGRQRVSDRDHARARSESAEGILVTAAIRDISRRKEAEAQLLQKVEELKRSNEELGQFAYIASHDLQEPLRMVASYTQLLSRRYKGKLDSDADEFIAFAVDGASRMQRLIQDLLAYSRVGTKGKDLLETASEKALEQALVNLRGAIEESGALVTHDPLPTVLADETQLVQLFQNLVGNAIKYQGPGVPRVHVSAVRDGDQKWIFSVRDNGLGIDPQYFERIFGMFQRLHKREEFAGTGIGLAICKKIVERHGGAISVESQPGEGSTFRFVLAGS